MAFYIITSQKAGKNSFTNVPSDKTSYLICNETATSFTPADSVKRTDFFNQLLASKPKDLICFIHGYNTEDNQVMERHRSLVQGFAQQGFDGVVLTYAWPSDDNPLMYLNDRHKAKKTAMQLVTDCISEIAIRQFKNCMVNVHLIAHSTGAYVIHEAFEDIKTTAETTKTNWSLSQVLFISGDVSADSMSAVRGSSIYNRCQRLTNYFNPYDEALALSNVKRLGAKNRVGRAGLPDDKDDKGVNIDCGVYYNLHFKKPDNLMGLPSHSWYFYSDVWFKDAFETIKGSLSRTVIPTRKMVGGKLLLNP